MGVSSMRAALLAGAVLGAVPAYAQPVAEDRDAGALADTGPALEEIVVTARKIRENLQEVPLSVTAFTAADLDRRGIREVSDLSSLAPGLNFEKDFGRRFDRPTIRGQSNILGSPNAASFIDGVFIPDSLFSTELAFVERVEIIKGPQSALYGRQTFSGAISYITRKPSDEFEATLRGTIAEHDEFDLLGSVSGPIVADKVAAQVAANYYTYGGEYRLVAPGDPGNGRKVGDEETQAVSGAVVLTPSDPLTLTFRASYAKNDDGLEPIALQRASFNNCFPNAAGVNRYYCGEISERNAVLGANAGSLRDFGGIDRETTRLAGIVEYDFGGATLSLISGYNDAFESRRFDVDNTSIQTGGGSRNVDDTQDIQSFSQEVRLSSSGDGPLSWIVGGYYYDAEQTDARLTYSTNVRVDNGTVETKNYAAFGLLRYRFTDRLSASAEVRRAEDKLRLVGGNANFDLSANYKSTNPRFTVDFQATDDVLIYGSVARGNKPGGFNSDVRLPVANRSFGEETAWNYEVGFKSDLFDRRLRLNAAAYKIDWKDQQLTQSILIPSCVAGQPANPAVPCLNGPAQTTSYILNVGSLDVKGFEVEAIAALTDSWRVNGSVSYNDAEFTAGTDAEVGTLTGNPSLVGRRPPNSPSTQYSLGTTLEVPAFGSWDAVFSADYGYRSRKFDQVGNFNWVPGRGVANARLSLENEAYSLALFVRNLFDNTDPVTSTRWSDFAVTGFPRAFRVSLPRGRQFGVTAQAKF